MTIERADPPDHGDELSQLRGFLDYHRDTLRTKTAGLDATQLAATLPPSDMTLGGMLKHLALVEHQWFWNVLAGEPDTEPWATVDWNADHDWDWHSAVDDTPEQLRALFDVAVARSDAVIAASAGPEARSVQPSRRTGELFNLRWIMLHMIEEYARHNGHADLIRQSIDGVTGE